MYIKRNVVKEEAKFVSGGEGRGVRRGRFLGSGRRLGRRFLDRVFILKLGGFDDGFFF